MAVLGNLGDITVSIIVDGKIATEYANPDDKPPQDQVPRKKIRYIEAVSNSNYAIDISIGGPYKIKCDSLVAAISIDNKEVVSTIFHRKPKKERQEWRARLEGRTDITSSGSYVLQKFKFATVETVDDTDNARIKREMKDFAGMGEIKISFHRTSNPRVIQRSAALPLEDAPTSMAEKADKGRGLTHGTSFEAAQPTSATTYYDCEYIDGVGNPIGVFIFKYRSRIALQRLLLIARTPSPDPFNQLSEQEIRELARQKFSDNRAPIVKTETLNVKTEIKSEGGHEKRRLSDFDEVESIDLTGDSMIVTRTAKKTKIPAPDEIINLD